MTTKDKLNAFENYVISQAQSLRRQNLLLINEEIQKEVASQITIFEKKLAKDLETEYIKLLKQKHTSIVNKRHHFQKQLVFKRQNYIAKVLGLTEKKLLEYKRDKNYLILLQASLKTVSGQATEIILDSTDRIFSKDLDWCKVKILYTGNFIGGYKAKIPPNILIENTFQSLLLDAERDFGI